MIGNALIERPEFFREMFLMVGVLGSVGAALRDPNGPVNWPEFGNPNTEAGFKALVGMSAYQKVQDGTSFPAVMLYHGYNDPRVAVWHSATMAARLQRASSSQVEATQRSGRIDAPVRVALAKAPGGGQATCHSRLSLSRREG